MAVVLGRKPGGSGGGGGGPPSGAAGGDLSGTYPDPDLSVAKQAEIDGKVPKSLFDANTVLAANSDDTPAAVTMGASTVLARLAAGNIVAATPAELRNLIGSGWPYFYSHSSHNLHASVGTWVNLAAATQVMYQLNDNDTADAQNDYLAWNVGLMPAGTYKLEFATVKFNTFAIWTWQTSPDGTNWTSFTTYDCYHAAGATNTLATITGNVIAAEFSYLRAILATRNASASTWRGQMAALSFVRTA